MADSVPNFASSSLVWLSPDVARQIEVSRYICFIILGFWLCEFVMSIRQDIYIWKRVRSSWADSFYVISRLATLVFLLSGLALQVLPIKHCFALISVVQIFYSYAILMSSNLFVFRIKAVFNHSRPIIYFFFALRLILGASSAVQTTGVVSSHFGPTQHCMIVKLKTYCAMGTLAVAVNDTIVLLAISTQLLMNSVAGTWQERCRAFFRGKGMGQVSRALMKTGQQYYIWTIGINICTAVVILLPSIPSTIRELMFYPNAAIVNIMACRALRKLRLEMMKDNVPLFSFHFTGIGGTNGPTRTRTLEWARPSDVQGVSSGGSGLSNVLIEEPVAINVDLEKGMHLQSLSEDQTVKPEETAC